MDIYHENRCRRIAGNVFLCVSRVCLYNGLRDTIKYRVIWSNSSMGCPKH
jgi:hypothetical protein